MKPDQVTKIKKLCEHIILRCDQWQERYIKDDDFAKFCDISGFGESAAIKRAILEFKYEIARKP